jgi:biopolymer transport protein ExbD
MRCTRRRKTEKPRLAMTPMIDVIFNLLIFFLLTPVLQGNEGYLTTNLPCDGGAKGDWRTPDRLKVELIQRGDSGGEVEIVFDGRRVLPDFRALEAELKELRTRGLAADFPVLIAPTGGVRHRWVVRAFDTITAARFRNICFAVPSDGAG